MDTSGFQPKILANFIATNVTKIFTALLIILPVFYTLTYVYHNPFPSRLADEATLVGPKSSLSSQSPGPLKISAKPIEVKEENRYLGGLLPTNFDDSSCLSRYQSSNYRKPSPFKPSEYLLSKLRNYEELHRHCGPGTQSYNDALLQLKRGNLTNIDRAKCNYVVWLAYGGLGNRMLSISASFLYALLTNRVLLVDQGYRSQMTDLFCEPFPNSSWFLTRNFPLNKYFARIFDQKFPQSHGNMLKNNLLNSSTKEVPPYLYLHLGEDADPHDKLFFCDEEQSLLLRFQWLVLRTNQYFAPSLYLIPSFEQELFALFPNKETIFHHLGRYLLHPTNQVWGLITTYYETYLAKADERVGIQMRSFNGSDVFKQLKHQMLSCIDKEKLLPEINKNGNSSLNSLIKNNPKSTAVLITSLNPGYYEILRDLYWENQTVSGEVVGFYQPSHEEIQQSFKQMHERKALAEMYLLSLSDRLVTSGHSTFGYVAQGLGGLKPWILFKPLNETIIDPPCRRAMSIEPCFHYPPFWDCKAKRGIDVGNLVSHVRKCEDVSWGVKLVDDHKRL